MISFHGDTGRVSCFAAVFLCTSRIFREIRLQSHVARVDQLWSDWSFLQQSHRHPSGPFNSPGALLTFWAFLSLKVSDSMWKLELVEAAQLPATIRLQLIPIDLPLLQMEGERCSCFCFSESIQLSTPVISPAFTASAPANTPSAVFLQHCTICKIIPHLPSWYWKDSPRQQISSWLQLKQMLLLKEAGWQLVEIIDTLERN